MSDPEIPTDLDPYTVLGVPNSATAAEIRSAYRKLALQRHPDKAPASSRAAAHTAFQELAFAYGILSDPARRARFDATGSTADLGDVGEEGEGFDWSEFFRSQFEAVGREALEQFREGYQGSEEERAAILLAYQEAEGDIDAVFENVMASDVIADEARFREIIDKAIEDGEVQAFEKYTMETAAKRKKRRSQAKREAKEAEELAKKMGVHEKLFGEKKSAKKGKGKKEEEEVDTTALAAIIRGRSAGRMESLLAGLEKKYGGGSSSKTSRKRVQPPPPPPTEEEFEAARAKVTAGRKKRKT